LNPPASPESLPGWFGKIPSLGDFATRRLPPAFVETWDQWLSTELPDARSMLGDAWPSIYAQAPISCFSLGSGIVDDHAWHGILVPSFDRVGRPYPLTFALSLPPPTSATMRRRWWAALVAGGRLALEPACGGADGVDAALASAMLAAEPDRPGTEPTTEPVTDPATGPELAALEEGASAWWTWSEVPSDAVSSFTRGLPREECFRKLLGAH
jgi:type VI secretion system protein ImpM